MINGETGKEKSSHWVDKGKTLAFSKEIDHLSTKVVYSIGRHRWDIDAKTFMDMGKHRHFPKAYENMLSIRFTGQPAIIRNQVLSCLNGSVLEEITK